MSYVQGSDEWKEMRRNFIMASDSPIIMGVSKYGRTVRMLWEEKLGLLEDAPDNAAMTYGRINEPIARALYEHMSGNLVVPEVVFHKDVRYLGASLDGLTMERDLSVEIKCTNKINHAMAKEKIIPKEFYPQLQHQMACLGHKMMHYFSYNSGVGVIVEVKRDEEYLDKLYGRSRDFWDCVTRCEFRDLEEIPL